MLNGDVLTDLDLGALVAAHERTGAEGTIALHRVEDPSAFGVVPTDDDGRVTAFIEKPPRDEAPTDLINAGTYVLEPSVLDRIAPDVPVNVERVTFPAMVADGSLYALDGDTYWLDAGTPATYLAANLDLITGRRGAPKPGVHPDAEVDGAVAGAVVGRGAQRGRRAPSCPARSLLAGRGRSARARSCGMPSSGRGPGSATARWSTAALSSATTWWSSPATRCAARGSRRTADAGVGDRRSGVHRLDARRPAARRGPQRRRGRRPVERHRSPTWPRPVPTAATTSRSTRSTSATQRWST